MIFCKVRNYYYESNLFDSVRGENLEKNYSNNKTIFCYFEKDYYTTEERAKEIFNIASQYKLKIMNDETLYELEYRMNSYLNELYNMNEIFFKEDYFDKDKYYVKLSKADYYEEY